jgi:hypothetical protein
MNDANHARPISRKEAQERADRVAQFWAEVTELEGAGIFALTEEQQSAARSYQNDILNVLQESFDIDISEGGKRLSLGMRIASFLGALALAASALLLFYRYWGLFSTVAQVSILVSAPILGLVVTAAVRSREKTGYFAALAALVTFAAFLLNIQVLGQIFNITPSDRAFLVWAAFAFVIAYSAGLRLLLAFGILMLLAFLSSRMGTWSGMYWIHFGERPENFLFPGILLFLTPMFFRHQSHPDFPPIYRIAGMLTVLLPLLILANWGQVSYLPLRSDSIEVLYQTAGFAVSALVIWLGIRQGWREAVNVGSTFFVIFLYTKFYDWWWDWMPKYLFFAVIGLSAVLVLQVLNRIRSPERTERVMQ